MVSINEIQDDVIEEFALFDQWMDKYEYIIDLGKKLPLIDEQYKNPDHLIRGCQSQVWMHASPRPVAPASEVVADRAGYITSMDTEAIGFALIEMGGGRRVASDRVDHSVGLEMLSRIGTQVESGQPLARVFAKSAEAAAAAASLRKAIRIEGQAPTPPPLIADSLD